MNMTDERKEEVERIQAPTQDKAHIRKEALLCAGYELQGARTIDSIMERELANLPEGIMRGDPLYQAYEEMIQLIADEVVKIGEELVKQAGKRVEP
jgi:hypothetical protein